MTQNNQSSQSKSLLGCLSRRVLSVAFALLVMPLLVHAILIYKQAVHQSITDNLNHLSLLSRSAGGDVQQLIGQNLADIKTVEFLGGYAQKKRSEIEIASFSKIALTESLSSFFLAERSEGGHWTILAAAHPERMSQNDIDPDEYQKILALGTTVYLFNDPLVQKKELRIGFAISSNRILISGSPLETISRLIIKAPTVAMMPIAAFSLTDTDLYYASKSEFNLTRCRLFAQEELFDVASQPQDNFALGKSDDFIGVKTPIFGNSFYLVMALTRAQFLEVSSDRVFNHLMQLTLLFALLGGAGVFFLTSRIALPLKQLFGCLDRVSQGDLKARYENDPVGFELNILGQKFNQMVFNLEGSLQEEKKQRLAKELFMQELSIGQEIQKTILNSALREMSGFVFSYGFIPSMDVSGDFYDVFAINKDKIFIVIADTAGKGISACLYSLGVRSMFRALAKTGAPLEKILQEVNLLFLEDAEHQGAFITAFVAILELSTHVLTFSSCGHPPALLFKGVDLEALSTEGIALGVDKEAIYNTAQRTLQKNDKLILYTDGVIEAQSPFGELYGLDRLKTALMAQKEASGPNLIYHLQKEIEHFSNAGPLADDVTLVCVEKRYGRHHIL